HPKIVRRLRTSPFFPVNHAVFAESDGQVWWVIDECVAGHMLADALKIGPLSAADLPHLMGQLAEALQTLHRAVIIRRSLAPTNIVVRDGGAIMLTDLELSKVSGPGPTVKDFIDAAPYQAPEVDAGEEPDLSADIYSWAR